MTNTSFHMTARRRAAWLVALLLAAPLPLTAQSVEDGALGMRVRVQVCRGMSGTGIDRGTRTGTLLRADSAVLALREHGDIPLDRVLRADVVVHRSRELEGAGILAGFVAGALWARHSARSDDVAWAPILRVPVYILAGGATGGVVGHLLSGREETRPLPLPASHGDACVR